jgi:uncharacterized protein HemX
MVSDPRTSYEQNKHIKQNSFNGGIMANNKTVIAAVLGWAIITLAVVVGAGFYFGLKYEQNQTAAKKAAVQDALKAAAPAPAVAQAPLK